MRKKCKPILTISNSPVINLGNTSVSDTPLPYKAGARYKFFSFGYKKLPFKWYYETEADKQALLQAVDISEGNPLVTDQNPLYTAVEITEDKFDCPTIVRKDDPSHGLLEITRVTLKQGYNFAYNIDSNFHLDRSIHYAYYVEDITSDGGITSYGSASLKYECEWDRKWDWDLDEDPDPDEPWPPTNDPDDSDEPPDFWGTEGDIFTVAGNRYEILENEKEVRLCDSTRKSVTVPATVSYEGLTFKVTEVAGVGNKTTSITMGNSVKTIGEQAFRNCKNLKTVKMSAVKRVGYEAFYGCTKLTSITLPKSVTSVDVAAFKNCKNLKTVTIKGAVKSISQDCFNGCTKLTSIVLPKSVTSVGYRAFKNCKSLKTVTIKGAVKWVSDQAFYGCKNLKSITLPKALKTIGEQAFSGCTKLTSITLPKSVTSVDKQAFQNCKGLKTVTIKSTKLKTVGKQAFKNCNKKLTVKVTKAKYSKYKKMLSKAGAKRIRKF